MVMLAMHDLPSYALQPQGRLVTSRPSSRVRLSSMTVRGVGREGVYQCIANATRRVAAAKSEALTVLCPHMVAGVRQHTPGSSWIARGDHTFVT